MGEIVTFPSNGGTCTGYLAVPAGGRPAPGVVVIQEWWGLVPHITDVCDRLAAEGFVALAPDLYRGETTTEPDEAAKLMMALNMEQAAKDLGGAVDRLKAHGDVDSSGGVGVIGFCMGGGLALVLAAHRSHDVTAVVPFYGVIPWPGVKPDWSRLAGRVAVLGHYAEKDAFAPPDVVEALEGELKVHGRRVDLLIYPGQDHAFFNDTRPDVYSPEASAQAWARTIDFLRSELA
ncbi:MAG: dienelactone hydrolase family protein [Acidimicrobiales bacterium]|nr:dienelactone hydrolase family protein [Acidimicrobiales bacterium]